MTITPQPKAVVDAANMPRVGRLETYPYRRHRREAQSPILR